MRTTYPLLLITGMMACLFLASCNNSATIAFPEKELGYTQPVTVPLQFTAEKKLIFDTAKQGGIKPVIKKLDLESLPSTPYDSTGFHDFPVPPETSPVDLKSLRDTAFSLDKLPSESLQFKTYALNPPAAVKVSSPAAQRGHPLALYDFGPKLGLPAIFITSLLKDKDGLMWIGSKEGLFRYDGEHVQTILPGTGETSVASMAEDDEGRIWFIDQVRVGMIDMRKGTISYSNVTTVTKNNLSKIIKDKKGRIWISKTISKAVFIIDPVAQTFKKLSRSTGLSDDQGANDIIENNNGDILITTPLVGLDIVNVEQGSIKYLDKTRGLAKDSLRAITIDKTGRIWIGIAGGGVDAINPKSGTITHYTNLQGLKPAFIGDLSADDQGKIWIGKSRGLDILDPEHNRNRFMDDSRGLIDSWVSSCTEDNHHRMWVSTIGGLHMIDQHAETVHPLGALNIVSLMEDTVGNLWVATQKGIRLIDAQKKLIRVLDKAHGLGNDFVQSFVKFNPQMWVTSDGGLDIINPIKKTMEHIGKKEGLVSDTVYVAYKDNAGNTWFTGPSNGIDVIDSAKQMILHTDVAGGLADNNILDVKEDNNGLVWLAGSIGGINIIDLKKRTVKYLNNQPGLRDTSTKMMLTDRYGRLWIGTDKGIYVVDKERGTLTFITTSQGLSHNKVTSLLEYKGSVLAGTQDKVTMITAPAPGNTDSTTGKWNISILNKSESLVREVNNAWATDAITQKGQYLWGDNGITVINDIKPTADSSSTFITGLNVMNRPQYFINKEELKETDTVQTADTVYTKGQTPVFAGYASTKTIRWDSVAGAYNMPVNMQIPYDQNYLQFQFAQAHLGRQDATRYTYILEGIDKNWSTPTTNTYTENYLNLPPGKYSFKVCSKEATGKWSQPASFSFTILPPWWKTWWAYTLLALLCAGILRAYIIYRSAKLQRENKVLEEKVTLRTQQLQQSIEDLKSTQTQLIQSEKMASLGELTAGIAHEIQNPLNFINNFSDVNAELIADLKEELNNGNIEEVKAIAGNIEVNERKINHHGKRADSIVKGMLQHSRTGSRQKETANINALADEYFRLAYHGLRAKDKSFNATLKTDFDENIEQVNIIPQDIGRVILNLITNAFYTVAEKKKTTADKVSGDKYEPTVWVSTKKTGDKIEIKVKDNGKGIPLKVRDKIFQPFFTTKPTGQGTGLGLSLAYDIVKAHGGDLKVDTKEGEGSEFTIQLPL